MENINFFKGKGGFTLLEIVMVVAIIAVLAILSFNSLSYARITGRDTRRVADISTIRSALNLYYLQTGSYPTAITPGNSLLRGSTIILEEIPSNPTPRADNGCADKDYDYAQISGGISYTLSFCLGYPQEDISGGAHVAIPEGILPN